MLILKKSEEKGGRGLVPAIFSTKAKFHPLRLCKYCIQWMHYENAKFSSYFLPCRFGVSNGFHHVVMLIHKMIMWTLISAFPSVYAETR